MRPGDMPAKEGDVFAIKKFKPDKEGDQQTYAGISQSGAREIMVCFPAVYICGDCAELAVES